MLIILFPEYFTPVLQPWNIHLCQVSMRLNSHSLPQVPWFHQLTPPSPLWFSVLFPNVSLSFPSFFNAHRLVPLTGYGVAQHFLITSFPHASFHLSHSHHFKQSVQSTCHKTLSVSWTWKNHFLVWHFAICVSLSYSTTYFLPWIRNLSWLYPSSSPEKTFRVGIGADSVLYPL